MRFAKPILFLLLSLPLATLAPAAGHEPPLALCRGIGIHNAMNWPELEPADAGTSARKYVWPPFSSPSYIITAKQLEILRSAGFDFVRLTVDPAIFIQTQEPRRSQLYAILVANVRKINGAGLKVVVDLHPVTQNPAYPPTGFVQNQSSPAFIEYRDLVGRVAATLARLDTSKVAFEIMNEPPLGWDEGSLRRWHNLLADYYQAARTRAPDLTLIISGGRAGSWQGLTSFDPTPYLTDRVMFTFHYYEPHFFTTFPGAKDDKNGKYLAAVPFPASEAGIEASYDASKKLIEADKSLSEDQQASIESEVKAQLDSYLATNAGPAAIQADFDRVSAWASQYGVPGSSIFLGELGVVRTYGKYHGATEADRTLWLKTVRAAAERAGIPWAVWAYKGYGGMAITRTDNTDELDESTLDALGLGQGHEPASCPEGHDHDRR